jgi:ribonucleoside-diphosphate reductase alpha chain
MAKGFYSLSSPIWANFGLKRGLPISCFGSYVDDTMEEILKKSAEVGIMTKCGGGTSGYFGDYFGDLRERGAEISSGGKSNGPVHFLEIFETVANVVSQSNVRRGSFAAYMPVDHPDILEFLEIRGDGHSIQNLSIGVCIGDDWMKEMLAGDKDKRKIWGAIINLKIHASNLCVTGDQRVPTQYGMLTAKELHAIGKTLKLFDNENLVDATPMQLIEKDAEVYKVTLDNGMSHTITAYHKVLTSEYKNGRDHEKIKECQELTIGDRVAIQTNKGIFGQISKPKEAFLLGLYQSDGTQHKDTVMFDVWENDFDLLLEVKECHDYVCDNYNTQFSGSNGRTYAKPDFHECTIPNGSVRKKRLASKACKKALNFEKGYVPSWIFESDEETQWQYIRGLLYADGTAYVSNSKGNPIQIAYADINKEFLQELQLIFANLGLQSSIRLLRKGCETLLPDGCGDYKHYNTQDCWRLIVGNKNDALIIEKNTGFLSRKNIHLEDRVYRDNSKKYYKINSIEKLEDTENVYCVKVDSDEHLWVCNGFITHNCSEIALHSNPNESFVCNLSSLNLVEYDEWKDTDAPETLTMFLDAVMTEFIQKCKKIPFMDAPAKFAEKQRALGIGVLGWHSFLQSKNVAFESMQAKLLNAEIHKLIFEKTQNASKQMAQVYGEPEILKGYGLRNVTTMAIAPTTSSSFILGQVSPSIEPLNSNYFVKDLAKGKFTYKNPYLEEVLKKYEKNDSETWKSILVSGGSVQHLDFLTDDEKDVFKTFGEISQKEVIIQAAQRQKFIDQAQSLNIMVHPKSSPKDVSQLMIFAWEQGVKSLYYQRGTNPAQELSRNLLECQSCSG